MSKFCVECGIGLGPLTGALEEGAANIDKLRDWEVNVPSPLCAACFGRILDGAKDRLGAAFAWPDEPPEEFLAKVRERRRQVEITTGDPLVPGGLVNLGLVTGHAVVGTGPLADLASALTDVMVRSSKVYADKLDEAEAICLLEIRAKAVRLGATMVANLTTGWSELTAGHGMLLVAMAGTALGPKETGSPDRP